MTTDKRNGGEMLPLPEFPPAVERFILSSLGPIKANGARTELRTMLRAYARANVERALAESREECRLLAFELDMAEARNEEATAYTVVHRGALRYCNSNMRDAYSDQTVRAGRAEARAERLAGALREVDEYLADREDVIDGDYGVPAPNDEMRLRAVVSAALTDQETT